MNARALLIRGLIAGLVAGVATFVVAYAVGEPHIDTAVSIEDGQPHTHSHDEAVEEEGGIEVSRDNQKTWGLLTGTLTVGLALGGIVALVAASTIGRLGSLAPSQSTALVALLGFVAFVLVPFLKYPGNPPAVGSGETIGDRAALYFGFVLVSVLAAVASTYGALKVRERLGTYGGVVAGIAAYLAVVVVAGQLFVTVNEVGAFPADTLWFFRRASLITLATMWGVIGVVLTGLVSRLYAAQTAEAERRQLAAGL
ncbi:CbtA family protein [Nocardioides sp.]|uniref:CbtA family protein n=1 Tax=Nocardioides sp. TaxID=35761 RepID=UPI00261D3A62|nr:CbtA family protein [Nocardioides sp.]MDI6911080.1 CbtA family protein [Nocardioides sp.]